MTILAERIRARKTALGMSCPELAKKLYVSASAVQQWQTAGTIPRADMIPEICKALKCTPNYLFGFTEKANG